MGLYPAPPGLRQGYDRDNTVGFYNTASGLTTIPAGTLAALNGESSGGGAYRLMGAGPYIFGLVFPHKRDIQGYFLNHFMDNVATNPGTFQWSANTTTGIDGTWTTKEATYTVYDSGVLGDVTPAYRTLVHTLATPITGAIGIRWNNSDTFSNDIILFALHLYGFTAASEVFDRLAPWHPTIDQLYVPNVDMGDVARPGTYTQQFRVKNQSAAKTAHSVTLTMEALTDSSPSQIGQYQLSYGGSPYATSVNIGDLAPGAISGLVTVRDTLVIGAQAGLGSMRLIGLPASWV